MLDNGARRALLSNIVSNHTRKATTMHRILCKRASHAIMLADVLTREGHAAVWYFSTQGPAVGTNASIEHIMRAVDTTETLLKVPARKRTRRLDVAHG